MSPSDKPMFLAALNELAALKPNAKLTTESYTAWWNAMQGWELSDFRAACARLRDTCEFMPNPFHFEQLRKASRLTSGEAWARVRAAVRAGDPCPDDPTIYAAVGALGGMRSIGMTNSDQMQFLERRFAEHFDAIADRADVREALPNFALPRGMNKLLSVDP